MLHFIGIIWVYSKLEPKKSHLEPSFYRGGKLSIIRLVQWFFHGHLQTVSQAMVSWSLGLVSFFKPYFDDTVSVNMFT